MTSRPSWSGSSPRTSRPACSAPCPYGRGWTCRVPRCGWSSSTGFRSDGPLASARQRAVAAHGGNGFMTVAAAHAALLLAQGAGRLLRTMTDRGVVAVLDPRLVTERYGDFLR